MITLLMKDGTERGIFPSETIVKGGTMYDIYNDVDFSGCVLLDCSLQYIRFVNCNFRNSKLDHCLIDASFYACNMRDCRFIQCRIFALSFYHSTTDGMVF